MTMENPKRDEELARQHQERIEAQENKSFLKKFIRKWGSIKKIKDRIFTRFLIRKINRKNRKFWQENEVVYSVLPDGTKCTGFKRKEKK